MKIVYYFLSMFLFCSVVSVYASEQTSVKIDSILECEATVQKTENNYIVDIKMESVEGFAPATNKMLSIRKANNLALVALLKYLYPKQDKYSLSCSGMETIRVEYSEDVCHVVCRIPQDGIKIINPANVAKKQSKKKGASRVDAKKELEVNSIEESSKVVTARSSLLTKKSDYNETIDELANVLIQSAPQCIDSAEKLDVFNKSVADFEKQIKNQYAQLKKKIEEDRELLTIEKSELLETLVQSQNKPMQRLKTLAKCAQSVETIDKLTKSLFHSAPQCVDSSEKIDDFYEALSGYEEKINKQFAKLKVAIEQENDFLSTDKSKLLDFLTQSQSKPMQRLKALAKCAKELETLKDFESEPEYAEYLLSNPFYRNHGGVEVYRSSAGYGLISLGSALISQESKDKPAILLRKAQRVAELRAKAELAGEIEGKNVETKKTFTETVETNTVGSKKKVFSLREFSQIIHESASAFLENVRPVASWRSADGEIVYVVLGMFREKK